MKKIEQNKFRRTGLVSCPQNHTALGHPFFNQVFLEDGEGIGSEIEIECGLCFQKFKGKVIKISEAYIG